MAKKKRLRLRFSLMTLLVGVTVLCVWLAYQVDQATRQRDNLAGTRETESNCRRRSP